MRRFVRLGSRGIGALLLAVALYVGVAFGAAFVPINRDFTNAPDGIDIFVASNGVHTDIVLPVRSGGLDWARLLNPQDGQDAPSYVGFGWGDRAFYLETRRWSDLRLATAFNALVGRGPTVMHVVWQAAPIETDEIRRVRVTQDQLDTLEETVRDAFVADGAGYPIAIAGAHYGTNDAFYEAKGSYSLFVTCNEFVRRVLATAGIRTAFWAPFDFDVLWPLPQM